MSKTKVAVLQLGGAAPVVNKTLVAISKKLMESGAEVLGAKNGIEGILTNTYISLMNERKLELIDRMPGAALGTSEIKVNPAKNGDRTKSEIIENVQLKQEVNADEITNALREQKISHIYMIGGDSTAWIANEVLKASQKISDYNLTVVHALKTIDNDVTITDHTLGYGSCARFVATAAHTINQVNQTKRGIHIIFTMGRDAGYIAAASSLLGGADLVYTPEIHFNTSYFLRDVEDVLSMNRRNDRGRGRAVVVISEGVREYSYTNSGDKIQDANKEHMYRLMADIASERLQISVEQEKNLRGTALSVGSKALEFYIYGLLKQQFPDVRTRTDVLGYIQQGYPDLSEIDVAEAKEVGAMAVQYSFEQGRSGSVIIKRLGNADTYTMTTEFVELEKIAGSSKQMPRNYISAYGKNVTDIYLEYAGPLIGHVPGFGDLDHILSKPLNPKEFIKR